MGNRDIAIATATEAAKVLEVAQAMVRIEQDGYTRIDPFKVAASAGIPVLLRPMDRLLGAFMREDSPGILINTLRSAGMIHMTCAHELGHFFMGHATAFDETIDYGAQAAQLEQEADWFGYHLLVPRRLLSIICRRKGWDKNSLQNPHVLYQMSLRLGISYRAAAWSLYRHKIFSYDVVQNLLSTSPAQIKAALLQSVPMADATKEVWLLDEHDRSSVLEPRPDDVMVVRLPSHASAGYLWQPDSINQLESEGFALAPLPASEVGLDQLSFGADSTMDYMIQGGRLGFDSPIPINLSESRPWEGKQQHDSTFTSHAHFEPIVDGLSREAKQALLLEVSGS
ncbi:ImmA/IrrE family metallo-endopeptidase [Pseudomonas sp. B21-009]|uniref:ImmA/IrrE family metallo-endopeptidase n=1 Tax=Pseudomonas sp. B21-009 TaxID=2895470 RepID=UPI00215F334B|nr:ImmA/IrrE family metallo-endopeptidase [Pseudomonas sp. B21-009]UVM66794.1 ImmA/IrrE family metallo-endopeptidase [Pseudomonas sp. B21-009]